MVEIVLEREVGEREFTNGRKAHNVMPLHAIMFYAVFHVSKQEV